MIVFLRQNLIWIEWWWLEHQDAIKQIPKIAVDSVILNRILEHKSHYRYPILQIHNVFQMWLTIRWTWRQSAQSHPSVQRGQMGPGIWCEFVHLVSFPPCLRALVCHSSVAMPLYVNIWVEWVKCVWQEWSWFYVLLSSSAWTWKSSQWMVSVGVKQCCATCSQYSSTYQPGGRKGHGCWLKMQHSLRYMPEDGFLIFASVYTFISWVLYHPTSSCVIPWGQFSGELCLPMYLVFNRVGYDST